MIRNRKPITNNNNNNNNSNSNNNNNEKIKRRERILNRQKEQIEQFYTDFIIFVVMFIHVVVCPFTKVEESFNLQGMHDIINIGNKGSDERGVSFEYDHLEFPGVIPRTFIGSLFISSLSYLPLNIFFGSSATEFISKLFDNQFSGTTKMVQLYFVRLMLGTISCISIMIFKRSISKRYGNQVAFWFTLITVSQFHLMFYISRPLPNIFALILVIIGYSFWLNDDGNGNGNGSIDWMIMVLTIAIFIFRSEILILAGPIVLSCLFLQKNLKFHRFLIIGIFTALISIVFTVFIDSYFWRRILYPEYEVFQFNTIENKSSEWGTLPFHWYFSTALPKTLAFTLLFFFIGLISKYKNNNANANANANNNKSTPITFLLPILLFIGIYSILPHKEIRFIFYSIPIINLISAIGATKLWNYGKSRKNQLFKLLISLFTIGILIGNSMISLFSLYVSSLNYPGGHSMISLHKHLNLTDEMGLLLLLPSPPPQPHTNADGDVDGDDENQGIIGNCKVHIDNMAAISGVSRFSELNDFCVYSKKERDVNFNDFDYLIAPNTSTTQLGFKEVDSISAFDHIKFKKTFPFFEIVESPTLYIMEKINK
ncbi:hypothetical protein ACTFIW_007756 [Dictyostelium discoideum]